MQLPLTLALGLVLVLAACADDSVDEGPAACPPEEASCGAEDFDEDGVINELDAFPRDAACFTEDPSNCGACGAACVGQESCVEGACACEAPYGGDSCGQCLDPLMAMPGCDECVDPRFTGPQCDVCADSKFAEPECIECADPIYTGANCDQCTDPAMTGTFCNQPAQGPDTGPPICPGIDACVFEQCAGTPIDELEECATMASLTCSMEAETAELDLWAELLACKATECLDYDIKTTTYDCWRVNCIEEIVDCYATSFGDTKCFLMGGKVAECEDDAGEMNWACYRDGINQGTEIGVTNYLALQLRIEGQCHDKQNKEACLVEAKTHPSCIQEWADCGI